MCGKIEIHDKFGEFVSVFLVFYPLMHLFYILFFFCLVNAARFVLEPKSVLMEEQEQKFKDSETAITSLQVCFCFFLLFLASSLFHSS